LGHPSKFQPVSHFGFVTAATSLTGGKPNFARCLAVSWPGTLYIPFRGLFPLTEFCQVQNSLCVQVLSSPILAALLHSTPAAGVSQTLKRGTRNGITEPSQRAPPIFGWAAITLGIGPHSSFKISSCSLQEIFLHCTQSYRKQTTYKVDHNKLSIHDKHPSNIYIYNRKPTCIM